MEQDKFWSCQKRDRLSYIGVKLDIDRLKSETKDLDTKEFLEFFLGKYGDKSALSSSLGVEDQVLTDMISKIKKDTRIFTLDTGRVPYESYDLLEKTEKRYKIKIKLYFPMAEDVQEYVNKNSINAFYDSLSLRKECCHIRKIKPLKRALKDIDIWITGLRSAQSVTRGDLERIEYDENFNTIKINPLLNWSQEQLWEYVKEHNVPVNELHFKGYPSIGCAPCTRAVAEGEDIRSGRWWWESKEHKECGLHIKEREK